MPSRLIVILVLGNMIFASVAIYEYARRQELLRNFNKTVGVMVVEQDRESRECLCKWEGDEVILHPELEDPAHNFSQVPSYCHELHFGIDAMSTGHVTEQDVLSDYLRRGDRPR